MLLNYKDAIKLYENDYKLKIAIEKKYLYKLETGIYSTKENVTNIELFLLKHKNIVFTLESAFYYLGISDYIPDKYNISINKNGTRCNESNVKQYFCDKKILLLGIEKINYCNITIPIYNRERLLIETLRYKDKLPYDYYKEIINYYRENINEINLILLFDYLSFFPKSNLIKNRLKMEVL